jgi:hypothetical protein
MLTFTERTQLVAPPLVLLLRLHPGRSREVSAPREWLHEEGEELGFGLVLLLELGEANLPLMAKLGVEGEVESCGWSRGPSGALCGPVKAPGGRHARLSSRRSSETTVFRNRGWSEVHDRVERACAACFQLSSAPSVRLFV